MSRGFHEVVKVLQDLIQIDSQNPPGDERAITAYIKQYLSKCKVKSTVHTFAKNRPNLVCQVLAKNPAYSVLITPHTDTVPVGSGWRIPPFSGKIVGGNIYGRGATDCKCHVAASLVLIKALKTQGIILNNLNVIIAFTADEETGSQLGIKPLMNCLPKIEYGLVLDADEFDIIVAQKGLLHLRVEVFGREAHGAYPHRGVNAVAQAVNALAEIEHARFSYSPHKLLQKPTVNIGRFYGGEKVNIVPGYACFELDIRYLPSMNKRSILSTIQAILKKHIKKYRIKELASQDPIEIDTQSLPLTVLKKVLRHNKIPVRLKPSFGATVINYLRDKGVDAFSFGFGTRKNAHVKDECIRIDSLVKGTELLQQFVIELDNTLQGK